MKRDWDLIRKILIGLEGHEEWLEPYLDEDAGWALGDGPEFERYCRHVNLLIEAGLIVGVRYQYCSDSAGTFGEWAHLPVSLTWSGHEFLDSIRNEGVWGKIKATAVDKGAELSFDIVKELGLHLARSLTGLSG